MSRFLKRQKRFYLTCCVCCKSETALPKECTDCNQQCQKYICSSCFLGNNNFRCARCVYIYFYSEINLKKLSLDKIITCSLSQSSLPRKLINEARQHRAYMVLKNLYLQVNKKKRHERYNERRYITERLLARTIM